MLDWGWAVNATPQPLLPPGKRNDTHCIQGWVGLRVGVDGCRKMLHPPIFNIQSPACSESLYQLGYSHPQLEVICEKRDYRQIFFTLINHKKILPHSSVPICLQHSDSWTSTVTMYSIMIKNFHISLHLLPELALTVSQYMPRPSANTSF